MRDRGAPAAHARPLPSPARPPVRRRPSCLPFDCAPITRKPRVLFEWWRVVTSAMYVLRCALLAALAAAATAAWQENVRPKVFAQLGEYQRDTFGSETCPNQWQRYNNSLNNLKFGWCKTQVAHCHSMYEYNGNVYVWERRANSLHSKVLVFMSEMSWLQSEL